MEPAGELSSDLHTTYVFGGFALDVDRAALSYADESIRLRPQSFDVLRYLVEHPGRLVTKNELISNIWGDTAVTDDSLTHCLIDIRKAIGDNSKTMIKTVSRRGFIFDLPVKRAMVSGYQPVANAYPNSIWKTMTSVVIVFGLAFAALDGSKRTVSESLADASIPVATDHLSKVNHINLAYFLFAEGRYDAALEQIQRSRQIYPELPADLEFTGTFSFILLHQYERALVHMESLPPGPAKNEAMGMAYHALGRESEAQQAIDSLMLVADTDVCIRLAELQAFRQDIDAAYIWLTELRNQLDHDRNPTVVHAHLNRVKNSPFLIAVRADPRWVPWLAAANQLLM